MKRFFSYSLCCCLLVALLAMGSYAKNIEPRETPRFYSPPVQENLPPDIQRRLPAPRLSTVASDTFNLGWYSFDSMGAADPQGWTSHDRTSQLGIMFHVANGTELTGGTSGKLVPLEGSQSMWCGAPASSSAPFCSWATLPGYGNNWDQQLATATLSGDSVRIGYKVFWEAEPGYDGTVLEYSGDGGASWQDLPVGQGLTYRASVYDGGPLSLVEMFVIGGLSSVDLRFVFTSDGAWSDEDGMWPTDGAILLDSISIETFSGGVSNGLLFSDFEAAATGDHTDGVWTGTVPAPFGDFAALYPGVAVLQDRDACFANLSYFWGFFDDPASTNYACAVPDPHPEQGAIPFEKDGVYISNEIWSPLIPYAGAGNEVRLEYLRYLDFDQNMLLRDSWFVRSWIGGCPGPWQWDNFVFFGPFANGWRRVSRRVGVHIDPAAEQIQIALGVVDMCPVWCNVFGTGSCHSHAPLYDEVHVKRINVLGPEFYVRHIDLFQDNFAEDGTLTGTARADAANDIAPTNSPTIQPGDSVTMDITNVGTDPFTGEGPAGYCYVAVWPQGQAGKAGADIQAPETRAGLAAAGGRRWPLVASPVLAGAQWYQFRMDTAFTSAGVPVADRFSIDLNDNLFTPGDTVCYFFGGDDGAGNAAYFHRTLDGQGSNNITPDINEAAGSPMEFTILPAGGNARGGDLLYVDDTDDRGGPAQLFFDTAFDWLQIRDRVDRYDVLGPSSGVSNSLGARVQNVATQIMGPYRTIIWNSGDLSSNLINDGGWQAGGGSSDKSPDFSLLFQFIDSHTNNPGVYYSADDGAYDWATVLTGTAAVNMRSIYMEFNLDPAAPAGDHRAAGEPISPTLDAVGAIGSADSEQLVVYGGCALINDFDLLSATGLSVAEYNNLLTGKTYVLSQTTPNSAGSNARFVLSGYSYHYIRDVGPPGAVPARVTHLENILIFMQAGPLTIPTGFDESPQLVNRLEPNYPNPFNPVTTIRYAIKDRGHVSLRVYNAAGQLVRTLVNDVRAPRAGGFEATWDGRNNAGQVVSSGVYFYRLVTEGFTGTRKMVLLK
ncbi:MAG: FlgD immunoglobulin-like domain containing protein [Candidatus Krumholzibacteriia bacterium]